MKFSENWLRELVAIDLDSDALQHRLTMIGLEVEGAERVGDGLEGVVVARIVACAKHPEADRLQVCQVDTGAGHVQIVCGAPNARAGLVAPLAMVGAVLPGGMTIAAATLRNVESLGMLCSARELGLDSDASGLMELPSDAPVGSSLAAWLGLPDTVIELGITPNRADCFSLQGIALDVAAACGSTVSLPADTAEPAQHADVLEVTLQAGAHAPRYAGRVVHDVDATRTTPVWMAERLRRSGIRPVSLLVDITQYVMIAIGQPMHAFDRDLLRGPIGVRHARAEETLRLLDGREVVLDDGLLVVTDSDRPVALAGIMGGLDTRVTDATRSVFLEAAHFAPEAIIGRARRFGLHTDAGHRFERGVDPALPQAAIEFATRLLVEHAGGRPGPVVVADLDAGVPVPRSVDLRRARLARLLGVSIPDADVQRILAALGLAPESTADGWRVTVPTRRFDLAIEEDLVEEVARIHGYDAIPTALPAGATRVVASAETEITESELRRHLASRDYLEAVNYAFVDAGVLAQWQASEGAVALSNPLSAELGVMRTQLLPGLVAALGRNLARQQPRVRLFEIGNVFATGDGEARLRETSRIAAVACGDVAIKPWDGAARGVDFHDLKGDLQSLAAVSGVELAFEAGGVRNGHPGRCARILSAGEAVGWIAELHPRLLATLDIERSVMAFEVDLGALRGRLLPRASALSRFPSVRRDLAFIVADAVPWSAVADTVREAGGAALKEVQLFDRYVGGGVETGFKSLAMGLILQDDSRTLTDRDADAVVASVVDALATAHAARIRG